MSQVVVIKQKSAILPPVEASRSDHPSIESTRRRIHSSIRAWHVVWVSYLDLGQSVEQLLNVLDAAAMPGQAVHLPRQRLGAVLVRVALRQQGRRPRLGTLQLRLQAAQLALRVLSTGVTKSTCKRRKPLASCERVQRWAGHLERVVCIPAGGHALLPPVLEGLQLLPRGRQGLVNILQGGHLGAQ